jgi:hypothetical protein
MMLLCRGSYPSFSLHYLAGPFAAATVTFACLAACDLADSQTTSIPPSETSSISNPSGRKYPPRIYNTVHIRGKPPVIDGELGDPVWKEGEWAGEYTQQMPTEGAKPSWPTELKILYDDRHIYIAIRAYDDPGLVHRYPGRRDDFTGDIVGVCFDSYNSKRTGFEFDLTAGGSKIDLILGNGETEWDTTWDAVWDGEVAHDAKGWTAEFRIPLSQLRYGPLDEQIWGMHGWRWIDRNQEESQWQLIPRQNTGRMHQLGELHGIRGLPRPRHMELLPHIVARAAPDRSAGSSMEMSGSVGLDAKIGLTSNFTLDATVNPDFGQVEADPSVINLTAYETFYEEKRPFFLEGRKILSFEIEDSDQLFYSRRIGQAPSYTPSLDPGESIHTPDSTTILGAAKITGRTEGGLSVAVMQSFTAMETAQISSSLGSRERPVEPFGSYTVGRIQKDWDKGNTSLGGMVTETHRAVTDPELAFLPTNALTGGADFTRYFANRSWVLEATALLSQVTGDRQAISALQTNAVHYFQRPDASHLGVDSGATSLSGHGGSVRFGRSEKSRLRLTDHFHWYSPGLDLNDLGFLRQADIIANQVFLGWSVTEPEGMFRTYSVQFAREDHWDFGGLKTRSANSIEASALFKNKWTATTSLELQQSVDTRALRGGPALRLHDTWSTAVAVKTDPSRRASFSINGGHLGAIDDSSRLSRIEGLASIRFSNRFSLSGRTSYENLANNLQYVAAADAGNSTRWLIGRIEQDTWNFTLRANLALTPDLTIQYYGSPFISAGHYMDFKRATQPLADLYQDRFHEFTVDEIAFQGDTNRYVVSEGAGVPSYSFANPDFSFRQFRSNLVIRWECRPGSTLYVVWSQGRTNLDPRWDSAFSSNWRALWHQNPDNVFLIKFSYWLSP